MGTSLLPYKMLNGCKLLIVHAFCVCRNILTLKNLPDCFFIFLIPSCHCCIFGVYLFILVEILHVYLQNTMQLYFCFALIQDELFLNQTKQILKMCGAQTVLIVIFNMFFLQWSFRFSVDVHSSHVYVGSQVFTNKIKLNTFSCFCVVHFWRYYQPLSLWLTLYCLLLTLTHLGPHLSVPLHAYGPHPPHRQR